MFVLFFASFVKGFNLVMNELQHKGKLKNIKEALFKDGCMFVCSFETNNFSLSEELHLFSSAPFDWPATYC